MSRYCPTNALFLEVTLTSCPVPRFGRTLLPTSLKIGTFLNNGAGSSLDRLLFRRPMLDNESASVVCHVRWPATRPSQHGTFIAPSPGDSIMQAVPTECLIHRSGGAAPDEQYSKLVRRIHSSIDLTDFKASVWTWWREQPPPRQMLPAHCLLRKAMRKTTGGPVHIYVPLSPSLSHYPLCVLTIRRTCCPVQWLSLYSTHMKPADCLPLPIPVLSRTRRVLQLLPGRRMFGNAAVPLPLALHELVASCHI